jgi:hypothetical protein
MKVLVHQWDTEHLRHKRETLIVDTPAQIQDRNQRANCKFKHTLTWHHSLSSTPYSKSASQHKTYNTVAQYFYFCCLFYDQVNLYVYWLIHSNQTHQSPLKWNKVGNVCRWNTSSTCALLFFSRIWILWILSGTLNMHLKCALPCFTQHTL